MRGNRQMKKKFVVRLYPASIKTVAGKKWGYINDYGQFVILPQFEDAYEFQPNGLAIVWIQDLAGLINQRGQFVLYPKYSSIQPFSEGLAVVYEEGQGSKIIDESGIEKTEKAYSFISSYQEGRAVFQDKTEENQYFYGYLGRHGKVMIPPQYQNANDFHGGKALVQLRDQIFALIDKNGKQLQTYPFEQVGIQSEGLLSFKKTYKDKAGYINEFGVVVIPPRFSSAMPFENDRAVVNTSDDYRNHYGLINKKGEFVFPPSYQDITLLGKNRAALGSAKDSEYPSIGSVYALADTTNGALLTEFIFDNINAFEGEYSSVSKELSSFFINRNGQIARNLPIIYGVGTLSLEGNVVKAFVDERISYYNHKGKVIWTQNSIIPLTKHLMIVERKYRPDKDYLVYYPQIQGMKNKSTQDQVNRTLHKVARAEKRPTQVPTYSSYSGEFSVQFFKKNLLVLEITGYDYPFGAAHGMPSKYDVHIDLTSGQIFQLKDLFLPSTNYVKEISRIIDKKMKENPENYFPQDKPITINENQMFYVKKDKLVIYFAPYEIAAFAFGFPEFEIPFEQIINLIDVNGAFWRSFH